MLELPRLGHGGTLDPFATGVLPLMAGKAMRLTKQILEHNKTYIAVFQFKSEVQQETLDDVMQQLTGRIYNVPPEISAVRVQVRTRKIHDFSLLDQSSKHIVARIRCEAGTYIRTMARDMGLLLDQPVELKELRREDSGAFTLDDCVELHEIADAIWLWKECNEGEALERMLHPTEKLLAGLPRIVVKDSAVAALAHGAPPYGLALSRYRMISVLDRTSSSPASKAKLVCFVKVNTDSESIAKMEKGEIARPSASY